MPDGGGHDDRAKGCLRQVLNGPSEKQQNQCYDGRGQESGDLGTGTHLIIDSCAGIRWRLSEYPD